jgi:hypothetical protein
MKKDSQPHVAHPHATLSAWRGHVQTYPMRVGRVWRDAAARVECGARGAKDASTKFGR